MIRRILAKIIEDSQMEEVDPLMCQLEQSMAAGHASEVRCLSREISEILWKKV